MAVVTSKHKRRHHWNHHHPSPNSSTCKRLKFSTMSQNHNTPLSNTMISRISRYPEPKSLFHREVHAPCRPRKFHFSTTKSSFNPSIFPHKVEIPNVNGNRIRKNNQRVKNSGGKGKVNNNHKGVVLGDSSVEEVYFIDEDRREVRSEIKDLDGKVKRSGIQNQSNNGDLNVVNAVKLFDTLSLSMEQHDLSSVHAYKKLMEVAGKRTDKISRLNFEIQVNETRRSTLRSANKKLVEKVPWEPFVPLRKEEEVEIARAFSANRKKVLVSHEKSNYEITGEKFQCLRPHAWLNDEVINLYLELLKEREKREPQKFLTCHFFNTFFYNRLISGRNGYDFKSVKRWTSQKKLGYGLHECDKIFIPIHKRIHWCLAVINKKDKKFQYLDSLKGMDTQVLEVLARYFVDEVKDKTGEDINVNTWEKEFVEDLPEQENGYDCGMFMIKYVDFYCRNEGLCFNQEHMPYFRLRTAKEILRLKAD